jgi:hypothetical protein
MPFLGKERINKIIKLYDKKVKLPAVIDLVDGAILVPLLNHLDKEYLTPLAVKLKPSDQKSVIDLIDSYLDQDAEKAKQVLENFTNSKIDIPFIEEETEGKVIRALIDFVEAGLHKLIKKI